MARCLCRRSQNPHANAAKATHPRETPTPAPIAVTVESDSDKAVQLDVEFIEFATVPVELAVALVVASVELVAEAKAATPYIIVAEDRLKGALPSEHASVELLS